MNKKHTGARSELIACAWLLAEGYEVFRNISPHGDIDLIGLRGEVVSYFDVKTMSNKASQILTPQQGNLGVKIIYVTSSGECSIDEAPRVTVKGNGRLHLRGRSLKVEAPGCRECGTLLHGPYRRKSDKGRPDLRPRNFCSYRCADIHYRPPKTRLVRPRPVRQQTRYHKGAQLQKGQ